MIARQTGLKCTFQRRSDAHKTRGEEIESIDGGWKESATLASVPDRRGRRLCWRDRSIHGTSEESSRFTGCGFRFHSASGSEARVESRADPGPLDPLAG